MATLATAMPGGTLEPELLALEVHKGQIKTDDGRTARPPTSPAAAGKPHSLKPR